MRTARITAVSFVPLCLLASCPGDTATTASASDSASGSTASTGTSTTASSTATTTATGASGTGSTDTSPTTGLPPADLPAPTTGEPAGCDRPGGCHRLDVLMVVDNSRNMGVKQQNFVAALPHLVDRLRNLVGEDGAPVEPDVNVMVTSTDMNAVPHLCESFQPVDYEPAMGAPVATACVDRLDHFLGQGDDDDMPQICTNACPMDQTAAPLDPFVHFAGAEHNVMGEGALADPVVDALECIVPQGISGCGFEAPLEAMRRALDPAAAWNQGPAPFLREGAALAVVILTDESDCSVEDSKYFDIDWIDHPEFGQYYEYDPFTMEKNPVATAVCWNGGMTCDDVDLDGVHESCVPEDKDVLLPLQGYVNFLRAQLEAARGQPVFMLLIAGVPSVIAHDPDPPHRPTQGGVFDLVYRDWMDGDILPGDTDSPVAKQLNFGIGPACAAPGIGYAIPPGRTLEVCQALDHLDDPDTPHDESEVRCCVESVCDADLAPAFDCLAGMLTQQLSAAR